MGVLRFVLGTSALPRVWRVACPDRDTVSARTAPETTSDDRPRLDHRRTRAVPSACLSFLWFENRRFSSSARGLCPLAWSEGLRLSLITKIGDFRTTTVDRLARRGGWIVSCRHPIPCSRGRGTVSAGWRVSAGRTPVFPGWFRRLSYRMSDPEWPKSCGCATGLTRFTPVLRTRSVLMCEREFRSRQRRERRGTPSLRQSARGRRRRDSLAASR
jgi:hypothetical protein